MNKMNIIIAVLLFVITTASVLFIQWNSLTEKSVKEPVFSDEFSLKELAQKNGIPPGELRHKLSHEVSMGREIPMKKPIKKLDIEQAKIIKALEHALESCNPFAFIIKYILWAVLSGVVVLLILQRKKIRVIRKIILVLVVVIFGIWLGATPSPMESIVKLFKYFVGMQGKPITLVISFVLFSLFSLWGAKLICSWGCQLGAFQETLFNIPLFKKKYKVQIPFPLSLGVRLILFIIFVVLLFNIGVSIKNFVVYHHINYFKIYHFEDLAKVALYSLPVLVIMSFFVFRPFCQFVCPFGLWAWILENLAINRIKIDQDKCIKCNKCVESCPTQAMKGIYQSKRKIFLPDCWSCGNCIEACPTDAISYGEKRKAKNEG